jgi:capsular polysaccharide biosynthesis protein
VEDQYFSFKDTLRVLARRPRPILVLGLIGLLLGAAYGVGIPALATARALVLLPPAPASYSGVATRDVSTETAIVMSAVVLVPAGKNAGLSLPYATLEKRVSATGLTDDIIQISAAASSGSVAQKLANAVAQEFVSYSTSQASLYISGEAAVWQTQAGKIQGEINNLNKEISNTQKAMTSLSPSSALYQSDQSLIDTLDSTEANNALQLRVVDSEIDQAQLSSSTPGSGIVILQRATTAQVASVLRIPKLAGIGLAFGLLIGAIAAFAAGRMDKRLRLRDDIARAAGAPVIASVSAASVNRADDLRGVLEHFDPSVSDKANLRRLLDEFDIPQQSRRADGPALNGSNASAGVDIEALVVVRDEKAVVVTTEIAAFAAKVDIPVALVVGSSTISTQQLAIACAARDPLDLGAARPNLITYASAPESAPQGVSLSVTLEVVDPKTLDVSDQEVSANPKSDRRAYSVLVVSPGSATFSDIQVVALAAQHRGRPLLGIVLAAPDQSDKTSGQLVQRRLGTQGGRQLAPVRSAAR